MRSVFLSGSLNRCDSRYTGRGYIGLRCQQAGTRSKCGRLVGIAVSAMFLLLLSAVNTVILYKILRERQRAKQVWGMPGSPGQAIVEAYRQTMETLSHWNPVRLWI